MSLLSVLMAEDNPDHQLLLRRALKSDDIELTLVTTGSEVLEQLQSQRFDCAVIDFNLLDCTAAQLLDDMAKLPSVCPAVIISSCEQQRVVIDAMRHGGVDFVPKQEAIRGDALKRSVELAVAEHQRVQAEHRKVERRQRHLRTLAETDSLTGLSNRHHFDRAMSDQRWSADRRSSIGCVLLDIDHFKQINDTHGHLVGDRVLKAVADIIRAEQAHDASGDMCVRWGGEEFLVIHQWPNLAAAWTWANQLRRHIAACSIAGVDEPIRVSVSLGVDHVASSQFNLDTIQSADRALYLAKRLGRNRTCTVAMADVAAVCDEVVTMNHHNVDARRRSLLQLLAPRLGPSQWQHVTEHCERVSSVAVQLAGLLNEPDECIESIRLAGLFHDIGKVATSDALLARLDELSPSEHHLVHEHHRFGQWIGHTLGLPPEAIRWLAAHQQPWRERQEQLSIPITGRGELKSQILAVADHLTTMVSHWPNRRSVCMADALARLRDQCDQQFAPEVIDAAHDLKLLGWSSAA